MRKDYPLPHLFPRIQGKGETRNTNISRGWLSIALIGWVTACTSATPTPTPPFSLWGDIITFGQAEQMDAPSLWPFTDRVTASWIGADETGIHQDMRLLTASGLSERVVLPLPPKNPYAQQMFPAIEGDVHLLWLDADADSVVRLYSALIAPEMTVERGPTPISEETTRRYTVMPNGDGSLWTISSGGLAIEPSLYAHWIDPQGRPRLEDIYQIARDADWPALTRANDSTIYLFWIRHTDGAVMRSTLLDGIPENITPISETITLNPGDRLVNFSAGLDATHGYLFWNVRRGDGAAETWLTSGLLDTETWSAPVRLGFDRTKGNFESGFNSGAADAARGGDNWLAWSAALAGQFDVLPVAAAHGGELGIAYLRGGAVVGYQAIVTVSGLIGLPALHTDRDRFVYLAWSEPNASGKANLNLTTTRRF